MRVAPSDRLRTRRGTEHPYRAKVRWVRAYRALVPHVDRSA